MRIRAIIAAAAAPLALGGILLATASQASAASVQQGAVSAVTHLNNHPDTTSVSGTATKDSPGGPVWAYDNIAEKFTVAAGSASGTYLVTISFTGSFHGFADPRTASEGSSDPGGPLVSDGSVKGTISYEVSSVTPPDPSALPGQSPSDATLGSLIKQLFGGNGTVTGGGAYTFTYHKVAGTDYTQTG